MSRSPRPGRVGKWLWRTLLGVTGILLGPVFFLGCEPPLHSHPPSENGTVYHMDTMYFDGDRVAVGMLDRGKRNGAWKIYTHGWLLWEGEYLNDQRVGTWYKYHTNGEIALKGAYLKVDPDTYMIDDEAPQREEATGSPADTIWEDSFGAGDIDFENSIQGSTSDMGEHCIYIGEWKSFDSLGNQKSILYYDSQGRGLDSILNFGD